MPDETRATAQWHERTYERSLKQARARAISRGDKFIRAAADLLRQSGRTDFTVQEVVDQAGMSLRSFYHHFATKDDLLLAVIEESMHRYIAELTPQLEQADGAAAKLELLIRLSLGDRHHDDPASRGMVVLHWHLAESRGEEFVATLRPQIDLIEQIIEEGIDEGVFRQDLSAQAQASLLAHSLLSVLDMRVLRVQLGEVEATPDDITAFCLMAVGVDSKVG